MRDQNVKCAICGCKVKGSLRFVPFLKDKLKWAIQNDIAYCPKHAKFINKK